jgi:hypothetical protein
MATVDPALPVADLAKQCLRYLDLVRQRQPDNPYATDLYASCLRTSGELAFKQGQDPLPYFRQALSTLAPIMDQHPRFLLGLRDLGIDYRSLGTELRFRGSPEMRNMFEKSLEYLGRAMALDESDAQSVGWMLDVFTRLIPMAEGPEDLRKLLARVDDVVARCHKLLGQDSTCDGNRLQAYAEAAARLELAGEDPMPYLKEAEASIAVLQTLKGSDAGDKENEALARYVEATALLRKHQDPGPALAQLQETLQRCAALSKTDCPCMMLTAQAAWVQSEWDGQTSKHSIALLKQGLDSAVNATHDAALYYTDAWQVVAETNLRLARAEKDRPKQRDKDIDAGLVALLNAFSKNPDFATGRLTEGALYLLRAQTQRDEDIRLAAAKAALTALEHARRADPLLNHDSAPLIEQAKAIAANP